jgi:hypothetical protein
MTLFHVPGLPDFHGTGLDLYLTSRDSCSERVARVMSVDLYAQ